MDPRPVIIERLAKCIVKVSKGHWVGVTQELRAVAQEIETRKAQEEADLYR